MARPNRSDGRGIAAKSIRHVNSPKGPNFSGAAVASALAKADANAKTSPTAAATVGAVQACPLSAICIEGSQAFKDKTLAALKEIRATKSGAALLADITRSGKTVTIKETHSGNACQGFSGSAFAKPDGRPGSGSNSTVVFNPDRTKIGNEPWETRPPAIGLAHELVHASHAANGTLDVKPENNDSRPDPADPTKLAQEKHEEVRTVGVHPYDNEPFSENSIRDEWSPKQPSRPWY
jgi:type VI secretion system secreted protein VgrG